MWLFQELPDGSNSDNSLYKSFWGQLQTLSTSFSDCQLLVFIATIIVRLLSFKVTAKLRRGEWEKVKIKHFTIVILQRIGSFSWTRIPWIFASFWLMAIVSKMLTLNILSVFSLFLLKSWLSKCFYSAIPEGLPST